MSNLNQVKTEMTEACHILAEHVMRFPASRHSHEWVKQQLLDILLKADNIETLAEEYSDEYAYAGIQNPYLVEVLKQYDQEV